MRVRFQEGRLERLETDVQFTDGHSAAVVKSYRSRLNYIRQAVDERDLYALKSFHYEKLQGPRSHQHSLRLNDQWRLIIELEGAAPNRTVIVVAIEDYH